MTSTAAAVPEQLAVLTVCLVVMKNGFTVIGKAAPASPENFNVDLGRKYAYEDGVRQLWPLMGFALRDQLAGRREKRHIVLTPGGDPNPVSISSVRPNC